MCISRIITYSGKERRYFLAVDQRLKGTSAKSTWWRNTRDFFSDYVYFLSPKWKTLWFQVDFCLLSNSTNLTMDVIWATQNEHNLEQSSLKKLLSTMSEPLSDTNRLQNCQYNIFNQWVYCAFPANSYLIGSPIPNGTIKEFTSLPETLRSATSPEQFWQLLSLCGCLQFPSFSMILLDQLRTTKQQ